jgi:radical SAM superfamily enzyme YgiQ (UPF0313 family)
MKVLLIYPPFAMPDKPYISIPALASYLRMKNIEVHAVDANIEFYRHFLSIKNIDRSEAYARNRLMELNGKLELNLPEMIEYSRLVVTLNEVRDSINDIKSLFACSSFPSHKKMWLFRQAIQLASSPFFPEWLGFTDSTNYIRYKSKFKKFSSHGILESLKHTTLFSEPLEHILPSNLNGISPLLVGISVAFPDQILPAFKCAQIIKKIMPGIHITLGGSFVSCHMREIKEPRLFETVDTFILDTGEIPLEKLTRELSKSQPDLSRVPGLVYLCRGKIRKNPSQPPPELDSLPPPDYTISPLDRYLVKQDRMALLFRLSRGCYWGNCAFCNCELPMIKCYEQSPFELVYQHLKTVIQQTGVRVIYFSDDAAPLPVLDYISNKMIEDNLNIDWVVNLRFDSRLTLERAMLFRKAGCRSIFLGLESCTDRVLKLMRKGISMKVVQQVLSNISWGGINANVYMIVGLPTETEEEALHSFSKVKDFISKGLIKNCIYNIFQISSYSPISLSPEKFGISSIFRPKEDDLAPPITDFKSQGMSRKKASELFLAFLNRLNDKFEKEVPEQVFVDKEPLHLNFSLNDINNSVKTISSSKKGSIFFPEFLKRYSDKARVFRN